MDKQESDFLYHTSCECGSSDGKGVFSDGHTFCFVCSAWTPPTGAAPKKRRTNVALIENGEFRPLLKRGISEDTVKKFGYKVGEDKHGNVVQIAPYYDREGNIVGQKIRTQDKKFKVLGSLENATLFGQQLWRDGGKRVVITEGEIDCMSVSQVFGNKWAVVSVPNGAQGAHKALKAQLEWLEQFEEIVIAFDNDKEGQKAARECAVLFKSGKVKLANWTPYKDANDYLQNGRGADIAPIIFDAKAYRPDGIITGSDLKLEDLMKDEAIFAFDTPYEGLNATLKGLRKGEITTFAAGSGIGKSTLVRECAAHMMNTHGLKIGYVALEESIKKTAIGLMAMDLNVPMGDLFLNRKIVAPEAFEASYKRMVNNGKLFLYDHFGSLESENLLLKLRYLAVSCDVDFIVLDHISIVVSGIESGEERRIIDNLMTQMRSLVENTGVGLLLVTHLSVPKDGKPHEEGGRVTLSQLRGSGSIKQLSDNIVALERNQQDDEKADESDIRVLKNRLLGDTGLADHLKYHKTTGRLLTHARAVDAEILEAF